MDNSKQAVEGVLALLDWMDTMPPMGDRSFDAFFETTYACIERVLSYDDTKAMQAAVAAIEQEDEARHEAEDSDDPLNDTDRMDQAFWRRVLARL